jgi:hypothetical membrane protein
VDICFFREFSTLRAFVPRMQILKTANRQYPTMKKLRIGAAAGIATPIVAFSCVSVAIASYEPFSWTNNALSDLGVAKGITAPIFDIGLVAAGVLAFVFSALGLFSFSKSRLGKVGAVFFADAAIALICIGIFNEHYSPTHYIVSVAFFSLAPIALFILTASFWRENHLALAALSIALGVVAAVPWFLQLTINYVPNVAIPETISAVAISVWAVAVSVKMLRMKLV